MALEIRCFNCPFNRRIFPRSPRVMGKLVAPKNPRKLSGQGVHWRLFNHFNRFHRLHAFESICVSKSKTASEQPGPLSPYCKTKNYLNANSPPTGPRKNFINSPRLSTTQGFRPIAARQLLCKRPSILLSVRLLRLRSTRNLRKASPNAENWARIIVWSSTGTRGQTALCRIRRTDSTSKMHSGEFAQRYRTAETR